MPSIFNSPAKREETWGTIKSSYREIAETRFASGLGALAKLAGGAVKRIVGAGFNFLGYENLTNPNKRVSQKIFPAIGLALGVVTIIPAAIVSLVGISVLVPPFSIAASISGVIRNIALYYSDRAERNNLRKILVTKPDLIALIEKSKLNEDQKQSIFAYATRQQDLYSALYSLRQSVIEIADSDLSFENKRNLVFQINRCIESVASGENAPLMLAVPPDTLATVRERLRVGVGNVNDQILQYRETTQKKHEINLPKSLAKAIDSYKDMRGKIFAQDLPDKLKRDIVDMIDQKKNKKAKIQDIFVRLGNHYINRTSEAQANMIARGKNINDATKIAVPLDFPAPDLPFVYKDHNVARKLKKHASKSKIVVRSKAIFKSNVSRAKRAAIRILFGAEGLARRDEKRANSKLLKQERKVLEADFNAQYKATFDAFSKNERLAYLEVSTKRRLANIGVGVAGAAVSIAATAMMVTAATPAAPVAIAGVALGAVGTAFTVASLANAVDLSIKESKANSRVDSPQSKVSQAVMPEFSEMGKGIQQTQAPQHRNSVIGEHRIQPQIPSASIKIGNHRAQNSEPTIKPTSRGKPEPRP